MERRTLIGVPEGSEVLTVDGVQIAVSATGQGLPVVCLHATGHGGGDFETFAALAGSYCRIVRVDWPGQGRSGPDNGPATPDRYAHFLEGVVNQLGIKRPVIIGNSIGGAAAIHYASRNPVLALVLCNTGGLTPVNAITQAFCRGMSKLFRAGQANSAWFRWVFKLYYDKLVLPSAAAATQRQRIIDAGSELSSVLASAWHHFGDASSDIRDLASRIDVPVWIAWARHDRVIPLWLCRPAIRAMKQVELSLFDGGHAAFLEQPEAFHDQFKAWLERQKLLS